MYSTELKINRTMSLKNYIEKDPSLLVDSNIQRTCAKCKKTYMPTKNDISTKRPSTYYKTCFNCRLTMQNYLDKRKSNI